MNVGLLTQPGLSEFRRKTLIPIVKDDAFSIKVAIIDTRPKQTLFQRLKKNLIRGRGGYILIMALQKFFFKKNEVVVSTAVFCADNKIDIVYTDNPYSDEILDQIKKYNLDILLLIDGFGIIRAPLLNIAPMGVLSYHHGDMRKYRGMPPAFWELYNNETEMGVTVQILEAGLDCGTPIEEKTILIHEDDTIEKLQQRAMDDSIDMMYRALKRLSDPEYHPKKIENFGRVYTLPNFRTWLTLKMRVLWRGFKSLGI